ncbi:DNA-binding protein [Pseudomonas sp.]|uniref:DNA-binding protein n=1 Tax=Pseudomonas sp. TaxID=306 RepID=UPI0039C98CE1
MIAEAPTVKLGTSKRGEPVKVGEWFRPDLLPYIFGISIEAARKYRSGGLWLEGKHWRTDPANRIVYSRQAIEAWMGGTL